MTDLLHTHINNLSTVMRTYDIEWVLLTSGTASYASSDLGDRYLQNHPEVLANFRKLCASQKTTCMQTINVMQLAYKPSQSNERKEDYSQMDHNQVVQKNDIDGDSCTEISPELSPLSQSDNVTVKHELEENNLLERDPTALEERKDRNKRNQNSVEMEQKYKEVVKTREVGQEVTIDRSEALPLSSEQGWEGNEDNSEEDSDLPSPGRPSNNGTSTCISDDSKKSQPCKRTLARWAKGMKQGSTAVRRAAQSRQYNLHQAKVNEDGKKVYECNVCCAQFDSLKDNVTHHKVEHVRLKSFPCRHCDMKFQVKKSWLFHMTARHGEKISRQTVTCQNCKMSFPYQRQLETHSCPGAEKQIRIQSLECHFCHKAFIHVKLLEFHMKLRHADEITRFKCVDCNMCCPSSEELHRHIKVHQDPYNQCKTCKHWCLSPDELQEHVSCQQKIRKLGLECEDCKTIFRTVSQYETHMSCHMTKENVKFECINLKFQCEICQRVCKTRQTYKQHKKLHMSAEDKPLRCEYCGKAFINTAGFRIHLKTHQPKQATFICDVCGKGFTEQRYLKLHVRKFHTGERPYTCSFCQKAFFTPDALRLHKKNHHMITPHLCEVCGQTFTSSDRLREHCFGRHKPSKTTRETPTKCNKCDKVLASRYGYMRHFACVHLKEDKTENFPLRLKKCVDCGKLFTCDSRLKRHMRTHTGEKPYECDICGKCFSDKKNLTDHKRIHRDTELYQCECGKSYRWPSSLKHHKKGCLAVGPETPEGCVVSENQKLSCQCGQICNSNEELQNHKMNCPAIGYPAMDQITTSNSALSGYSQEEDLVYSQHEDWSLVGDLQQSGYGNL